MPPFGQSRGEIDELKKLMRCVWYRYVKKSFRECGSVSVLRLVFERFESNFLRVMNILVEELVSNFSKQKILWEASYSPTFPVGDGFCVDDRKLP